MAKKIVRGITDVKTITNQDFDTNNVNDLLSDGQYNYIHRKKGKNEEYHNLTDNIKTLSSDNTELLSVTNYNKTTNTALLSPKHDKQKEQVLESTRDTITINHGTNGTAEKTTVDTNPKKVLEHEKLKTGDGLGTLFNNDETTIILKPRPIESLPANNGFYYGDVTKDGATCGAISLNTDNNKYVQLSFRESVSNEGRIVARYRFMNNNVASSWNALLLDDTIIKELLSRKEQVLESTRNTIAIKRGEKTTVDTNPQKVLEHENLISDSEYITLSHQTDDATTHIQTAALKEELNQLHQTKQDTLVAGEGITIEGQTISASSSFIQILENDADCTVIEHVETTGNKTVKTFSFEISAFGSVTISNTLKSELLPFMPVGSKFINGGLELFNNNNTLIIGNIKNGSESDRQQATFTFLTINESGGEGGGGQS